MRDEGKEMKDSLQRFSGLSISLHWLIAVGMIAMLAFGLYLEDLPRSLEKGELIGIHKSIGMLILLFAVWRFLLLGTLFMPISGVMMSLGSGFGLGVFGVELVPVMANSAGFEPNEMLKQTGHIVHGLGGKLLILAVLLHLVGALKHHFIDRDGTLRRMLGKAI